MKQTTKRTSKGKQIGEQPVMLNEADRRYISLLLAQQVGRLVIGVGRYSKLRDVNTLTMNTELEIASRLLNDKFLD